MEWLVGRAGGPTPTITTHPYNSPTFHPLSSPPSPLSCLSSLFPLIFAQNFKAVLLWSHWENERSPSGTVPRTRRTGEYVHRHGHTWVTLSYDWVTAAKGPVTAHLTQTHRFELRMTWMFDWTKRSFLMTTTLRLHFFRFSNVFEPNVISFTAVSTEGPLIVTTRDDWCEINKYEARIHTKQPTVTSI